MKSLTQKISKENKKRHQVQESIERKTKQLEDIMEKIEALRVELDLIQHEYNVRVGSLLLKDNQLDMEILQLKNLQELMRGGMTYQQAQKHEEDAFYAEILRMQAEQEKLQEEQEILDNIRDVSEDVLQEIRTVWKKLIRLFHPDLVTDAEEKKRREDTMKKINKAYAENNLEALRAFEQTQDVSHLTEMTIVQLEEQLVKVENSLTDAQGELTLLQHSTWFDWKKKREKAALEGKPVDIFVQLEQKFLDDIVEKIEIVHKLREEVAVR